jgi:hypothetical protein
VFGSNKGQVLRRLHNRKSRRLPHTPVAVATTFAGRARREVVAYLQRVLPQPDEGSNTQTPPTAQREMSLRQAAVAAAGKLASLPVGAQPGSWRDHARQSLERTF